MQQVQDVLVMILDDPDCFLHRADIPVLRMVIVMNLMFMMKLDPERFRIIVLSDHPVMKRVPGLQFIKSFIASNDLEIGVIEKALLGFGKHRISRYEMKSN